MDTQPVKILVVDDESGMREGCRKVLTSEGYEVETADDGIAGLECIRKNKGFAAALIDLKMPRMGGMELIEEIQKYDTDIVLLVITAYATINTAVEATKKGAYGYIPKPFTPDELLIPIKNGLEKRALTLRAKQLQIERDEKLLEIAYERSKGSTIIKCISDGVIVVNREGRIVLTNATVNRFLPECTTMPNLAPVESLESKELAKLISEALNAGTVPAILSKEITRNGYTYMVNASQLLNENGEILGAVAVMRDISELKKLEAVKASFISMVSHEVKSHLGAIEGYLNLILTDEKIAMPEDIKKMMERMGLRAHALRTMVDDLGDISAIETGRFPVKRVPADAKEMVHEAVLICLEKAKLKHIELNDTSAEIDGRLEIMADRDAIITVLRNLIDNAVKYTPEGGHVTVKAYKDDRYIKIAIADDGIGMSPDEKEKIFQEFYRVKNRYTSNIPGTGLGLCLVKKMLDMHDGKIEVESQQGKGSTFTVIIPKK